jgi:biotin carboxylase
LHDYLQVPRILDEEDVQARVAAWLGGRTPDRVEALWEPLVLLAAALRERFGVSGMSVDIVRGFRDKQLMKERVAAAGLRVPHSARVRTGTEARRTAERIGFPLVVKPIAGAGSADTYRVDDAAELERVLQLTRHVQEVSVEEFVEGEEFTYDTVSIRGRPVYENVAQYLPRPLVARTDEGVSPIVVTIRDLRQRKLRDGIHLGRAVLGALGMGTGFTHMEWYLKADGEVVFGEIGCRPAGAHLVDQMNFTGDIDLFREWARAVCRESFEAPTTRDYNCAIVFKRAHGQGRIQTIEGLGSVLERFGRHVVAETLLRPGTPRRDWKKTLVSDGYLIVRHPGWAETLEMARSVASDIRLTAAP